LQNRSYALLFDGVDLYAFHQVALPSYLKAGVQTGDKT
jgi:hypothetical protein